MENDLHSLASGGGGLDMPTRSGGSGGGEGVGTSSGVSTSGVEAGARAVGSAGLFYSDDTMRRVAETRSGSNKSSAKGKKSSIFTR